MKTLDRYIVATFVKNFLMAALALTSIFVFQALLGDLLDHAYPANQLVIYHLLNIPWTFVQLTPPAVLLATVLTISGLNRTNELTACYAIGIGLVRIVAVVVAMVFIISCLTLVLQDRILPPMFKRRETYKAREMDKKTDFFLDVKQNKIWYRSKNLIYNLRTFDKKSDTIYGMAVYTFDENFNLLQVIDAEKAAFTPTGWKLMTGTVTVFTKEDPFPLSQKFAEKELVISETPKDFQEIEKEVEGLRLKELWKYIAHTKSTGLDTKIFEVDFYSRISLSFIPMVMCILGVPFSTRSRREGGLAKDLGLCLAVTFFYMLFDNMGISLGKSGGISPILAAWLPSVIFAFLAGFMIMRTRK